MICTTAPRLEAADLQKLDCETFAQRYKVTSKLGQGGFCDVLCVKDASGRLSALKVLKSSTNICTSPAACAEAGRCSHAPAVSPEVCLFREARVLKHAKHPNVVSLLSVVHVPKACVADSSTSRSARHKMGSCWGLMLEYLQGGSLQQRIYQAMAQPHSSSYSYLDALTWCVDVTSAVAHLHSLSPVVIHRDLKCENILLLKPGAAAGGGAAAAGSNGRKLPVAKLTDFGLHVMIDRPPVPFFLSTGEDGTPLLILNADTEQDQQQSPMHADPAAPPDQQQEQLSLLSGEGADEFLGPWLDASGGSSDAAARITSGTSQWSSSSKAVCGSALKSAHQSNSATEGKPKHVAFSLEAGAAAAATDSAEPAIAVATGGDVASGIDQQGSCQVQQKPPQLQRLSPYASSDVQQWTRLTAGTLRRLSIDQGSHRTASGSAAGADRAGSCKSPGCRGAAIPLLLEAQDGACRSFVSAAVPAGAVAHVGGAGREGMAAAASSSSSEEVGFADAIEAVDMERLRAGSISSALLAANSQRDYEVNLQAVALAAQQLQRNSGKAGAASTSGGSCCARSVSDGPATPAAPRSVEDGGLYSQSAASLYSQSVRSGEWPTAASMMWDDLMEDDADQELLLDGPVPPVGAGHGGGLIELPLSYNLTGHTGSFMYMAPEVFNRKPYNESVDVYSLGVIMYELFSRTLLIYTHTPANNTADCEHYASMVAKGFRPKRPKPVPDEIWTIIESCWQQDPAARPAASEVLQQLQQVLQKAQAAAGSKGSSGFRLGKLFGRSETQSSTSGSAAAAAAAKDTQLQPGSMDVPADGRGKRDQSSQQASCPPAAAAAADIVQVLDSSSKDLLLTNGSACSKPAAVVALKAVPGSSITVDAGGLAATTTATASPQQPKKFQSEPGCGCVIC